MKLYVKNVGALRLLRLVIRRRPSGSDGSYTFTQVPTGSDYRICVTAW